MHKWTSADEERIKELWPDHTARTIARMCGWSTKSTENYIRRMRERGGLDAKRVQEREWTPAEEKLFIKLFNEGASAEYIAMRVRHGVGRCYAKITELRKKGVIEKRQPAALTDEQAEQVKEMYRGGYSVSEICKLTGILRCVVEREADKYGQKSERVPRMMMCGYCAKFGECRFNGEEGILGVCRDTGKTHQRCDSCDCGGASFKTGYWKLEQDRIVRTTMMR